MTEDPVKLYVVVMTILLAVLGFVAYTSYQEAEAYEAAADRARLPSWLGLVPEVPREIVIWSIDEVAVPAHADEV